MDKTLAFYMLRHVSGVGNALLLQLLNQTIHETDSDWTLPFIMSHLAVSENKRVNIEIQLGAMMEHLTFWEEKKARDPFILLTDHHYPLLLSQIYNPPAMLFYRGNLALLKQDALAVIGSRQPVADSYRIVQSFIPALVPHFVMVSGLAKGIDAYAHVQTLKSKGSAIAVVGNGLDYYYPSENRKLQERIAQEHLLLSEYPSGTEPRPYYFPQRNRIIAGLSNGVCVFQAGRRSGTFITASIALEEGRGVFAVPGSALSPHFAGCHRFIQLGAKLVFEPNHIIEEKWLYHYHR